MSNERRLSIDLENAVANGVIGEDQAVALRNLEAIERGAPLASEEPVGFSSLSDVGFCFVVTFLAFTVGFFAKQGAVFLVGGLMVLWAMGSWLDRRARLPLAKHLLFILTIIEATAPLRRMDLPGGTGVLLTQASWSIGAVLWWWRFRLPALLGLGVAAFAMIAADTLPAQLGASQSLVTSIRLALAMIVALFAILWDASDVRRQTDRSITGLWLHLVAAILFVSGFAAPLAEGFAGAAAIHPAMIVAAATAYTMGVATDRRVWLLVMLLLVTAQGGVAGALASLGAFLVGAVTIMRWNAARAALLRRLPMWLRAQLPRTDMIEFGRRPTRRHLDLRPRRTAAVDRLGGRSAFTDGPAEL